jgi:hypothetical protein
LLRGYLLAVYGLLFVALLLLCWRVGGAKLRRSALMLSLLTLGLVVAAHLPILQKNHQLFGAYMLSNQGGFELLQGHNSSTVGRFMYDWDEPASAFGEYVQAHIPNLRDLNQYQESQARAHLATYWVQTHPGAELRLWLRKTALFFSPENFISDAEPTFYHPVNAVVHLAFLGAILLTISRYRGLRFQRRDLLLLLPLLVAWLLSIVFFVGFRWRYFAEPAMIMFPLIVWQRLKSEMAKRPSC